MAELFKFRCPECSKLLGASPRKVGKLIHCPQCRVELIVPSPDEGADADSDRDEEAVNLADLGIDLGFSSPPAVRPAELPPARPVEEAEAISFLERAVKFAPIAPATGPPAGNPEDPDAEPASDPLLAPIEPLAPSSRRRQGDAIDPVDRRRDVVLPRTAVISWALFAILALGLSFVAGLMIGHYRWK